MLVVWVWWYVVFTYGTSIYNKYRYAGPPCNNNTYAVFPSVASLSRSYCICVIAALGPAGARGTPNETSIILHQSLRSFGRLISSRGPRECCLYMLLVDI